MLRESCSANNIDVNLEAIIDPRQSTGVPGGDELLAFANGVVGNDTEALDSAREKLASALGAEAVSAASLIVGNYSRNDRAANAIGIPMEPMFLEMSEDFRERLGINEFTSAANSLK
ncbi:MAG: hypothetical protein AAF384_02345 [Pseudomonadota bacterium]